MAGALFQVSSKLNDGRIFVIGADTFSDFRRNLVEVLGVDGAEGTITTMATSIEGAPVTIQQAINNVTASIPASVVPQTTTPSTAPTGRACQHGPMVKREGSSAKGPWKAFMCSTPKGTPDQCDPIFLRRNEPEWSTF